MAIIYWLARRLPACDEVLPLISRGMDQPLPWKVRIKILLHNHICAMCKRYANQLLLLRQVARNHAANVENTVMSDTLSFEARERMKRFLHQ